MAVNFAWLDDGKTIMAYRAEGVWNWADYHQCVRASLFAMHQHPHRVHSWLDFRGSTRARMPSGLAAHAQTFGKRLTPALSGFAVVLGMTQDGIATLRLDATRQLSTADGVVFFAENEDDAHAWLASLNL